MVRGRRWALGASLAVGIALAVIAGSATALSISPSGGAGHASLTLATPKVKDLCSVPDTDAAGLYPASTKLAYLENYSDGDLTLCGSGSDTTIATPPAGFAGMGYDGIAGKKIAGKLDLILVSWAIAGGYYCLGATTAGCASTVGFSLPSTFCAAQPVLGVCHPNGLILSEKLGFTYVDSGNAVMVTCKAYATSCAQDGASNDFAGYEPVGIAQNGSTLYVSDLSCTGVVWSGSVSFMSPLKYMGDSLEGIAVHNATLYVGDTGSCTDAKAHLIDVATGASLPTPLARSDVAVFVDSDLQFDSYSYGGVYSV